MKTNKKEKRVKGSLFTLLIINYVALTFILVIVLFFVFIYIVIGLNKNTEYFDFSLLDTYEYNVLSKNYDDILVTNDFGSNSYFILLNDKKETVYKSINAKTIIDITKDNYDYIPNASDDYYINNDTFKTNEGNFHALSIKYNQNNDDSSYDELFILDTNYNIVYGSKKPDKLSFTEEEYKLINNELIPDYKIYKYKYRDNTSLILFINVTNEEILLNRILKVLKDSLNTFLIVYFIIITIFILGLKRIVKKPLILLNNALIKFKNGNKNEKINYKGPKEFVKICDNFNDMAEKLRMSDKLNKELEDQKQKIITDVSHDLKTPITVIQGYSRAIIDGVVPLNENNAYLETIYQKSNTLSDMINTLYEYSKSIHPDYILNLEEIDICTYLRDILATIYNELLINSVKLEVDIPEKVILVEIDKLEMKRVIDNLVFNASKHNEKGITIYCSVRKEENNVIILIADNGKGIPKGMYESIFNPFVVEDIARGSNSSGLGLSISKNIIEKHHGEIKLIENKMYKTTFEIKLPIKNKKV
ncbi:MAG: HAMP domain-containing sensor histidine kinase [Bacilli bacterium]